MAAFVVSMVGTVQAEEGFQAKSLAEFMQLVKDGEVVINVMSSVNASLLAESSAAAARCGTRASQ